jgi:GDP-L-fucose synthase
MNALSSPQTGRPNRRRVFVAGHRGLVGSALVRRLQDDPTNELLVATREQLDLRDQAAVNYWFKANKPEFVYLVAGTVGGIYANATRPAEFIYDNMMIHATVVHASYVHAVEKLLYLGSSCIYPKLASQPITESELMTGQLEPTNESYAIAKIAGIKLCDSYRTQYGCNFISAMPTNLYGPNDNFSLDSGHVLPSLMRRFHEAKVNADRTVTIWGSGSPRREFLHVDDLADACRHLMDFYNESGPINVGCGIDLSIGRLAEMIRDVVYPEAELVFDSSKPDGTPRKLLDVTKLSDSGWRSQIALTTGIQATYEWFLKQTELRGVENNELLLSGR